MNEAVFLRYYLTFTVAAFGACVGSFLNVCIYRIPRELSVVKPRSRCPHCETMIAWHDNIPILSWLLLRARCRHCGKPISPRYVLVEALVAALFTLVWLQYTPVGGPRPLGLTPMTDLRLVPVYWMILSGLVLGTFVDLEHMIIPDRVSLGGIVAGLILSALVPALQGTDVWYEALAWSGFGAALGAGLLWLVAFAGRIAFRKEAMGLGDVKLLGAIGALLGWKAVLFTVIASSFVGSIAGLTLVLLRRKEMQGRIPYGPYLALAALIWMYWGPSLWDLYVTLITPAGL